MADDFSTFSNEELLAMAGISAPAVESPADSATPWSLMGEGKAVLGSLGRGVKDLASVAMELNPFYMPGGPSLWGINPLVPKVTDPKTGETIKLTPSRILEEGVQRFAPDMGKAQTVPGQILEEVAYYAPGAIGGGVPGAISAGAGGLAAGLTKVAGGTDTAKDVAGLIGSLTPAGLTKVGPKLVSSAERLFNKTIGVTNSAVSNVNNKLSKTVRAEMDRTGELPTLEALKGVKARGLFKGDLSAEAINERNRAAIDGFSEDVANLIDEAGGSRIPVEVPKFEKAMEYLRTPNLSSDAIVTMRKKIDMVKRGLTTTEEGAKKVPTLAALQAWKKGANQGSFNSLTDEATLDRIIGHDLKVAIEKEVSEKLPSKAGLLKAINKMEGEHLSLQELFRAASDKAKTASSLDAGLNKAGNVRGLLLDPIVLGTGASALTANPLPLVLGLGAHVAGAALKSRGGKTSISKGLEAAGNLMSKAGMGVTSKAGAAPAIAGLLTPEETEAPTYTQEQIPASTNGLSEEELAMLEVIPPSEDESVAAPAAPTQTSEAGLNLIKQKEGLKLNAYKDAAGVTTIGYGHTSTAKPGQRITEEEAAALLQKDVADAEQAVRDLVKVPLTQSQFDALVSFTYNVGRGALAKSTLLKRLNSGDADITEEFLKYTKAGGKPLPGLLARRTDEAKLFGMG